MEGQEAGTARQGVGCPAGSIPLDPRRRRGDRRGVSFPRPEGLCPSLPYGARLRV